MGFIWFLLLILLVYLLVRGSGPKKDETEVRLTARNNEWIGFIKGYRNIASTKAEKALIERMLRDIVKQGLAQPTILTETMRSSAVKAHQDTAHTATAARLASLEEASTTDQPGIVKLELVDDESEIDEPKAPPQDGVNLLLYFGAFLFVASVGLFITLGGASGSLRTLAIIIVMSVLYASGIWLYKTKPKLQPAGLAFTGIGMTIAPLVGMAAYYYIFDQTNAPVVWFATSILCMSMYTHALFALRRPLINYILIFTFLSLFQSGVSILQAPIYYFGWGMAFVGILLLLTSHIKGYMPDLKDSSQESARLFLPLSIIVSLGLVSAQGVGQLGISLLLAAAFYGLEALTDREDTTKQLNLMVAHASLLGGISCLAYAMGESVLVVALTLLALNVVQTMAVLLASPQSALWQNFATVLIGSTIASSLFSAGSPLALLATTTVLFVISFAIWLRQKRYESYALSMVALMILPLLYGQVYASNQPSGTLQAAYLLAALYVQLTLYLGSKRLKAWAPLWLTTAQQTFILSLVVVVIAAFFASPWACLLLCLGVATATILLGELEKDGDWAIVTGVLVTAPLLRLFGTSAGFAATCIALIVNILFSLRFRRESNRWLSVGLWLLLPISLAEGLFGNWPAVAYAWAYMVVMLGLVVSRAIARGSVFISSKVPLASYARSASMSYTFGYVAAGSLALLISFGATNSQFHTTAITLTLMGTICLLSAWVEKRRDIQAFLPLLGQLALWSAIRPDSSTLTLYLFMTSALAVGFYALGEIGYGKKNETTPAAMRQSALVTVFLAPAAGLFAPLSIAMPLGLGVAGLLVYYHVEKTTQTNREWAGMLLVGSVEWLIWFMGIRELQVYTHVLVAVFALYAYWRHIRGETAQSDQYLLWMLATATIPLALQAIGGESGGLYGWLLLLEQVGFMLLGITIQKSTVTWWGLYVAVGAVLYQLRNLGWAALTFLALFVIGIAIYKLQKSDIK